MSRSKGTKRSVVDRASGLAWTMMSGSTWAVDTVLDRSVAPGFSAVGYELRRRLPTWPSDPSPDALEGRHVLVTGASGGLGQETARQCAELGAHVHLVVRDVDRGEDVADTFRESATVWQCDISDLDSVREFVADFLATGQPVDALVHNAGVTPRLRQLSAQGHEQTMAVHVLGPVLMSELLRPALTGRAARVIFVTSAGMYSQALPVADPEYAEGIYRATTAYSRSKRTQVELLPILSRRWVMDGIAVWATHPGWADSPGMVDSLPRFERLTRPILRDVAAGADTTTWLVATEPRPRSGGLWHDRTERPTHIVPWTRTSGDAMASMWQWVTRAIGLPDDD